MSAVERMYLLFLFLAYAALMVVMFGFMGRMLRKGRDLEREVERLQAELGERAAPKAPPAVTPTVPGREVGHS